MFVNQLAPRRTRNIALGFFIFSVIFSGAVFIYAQFSASAQTAVSLKIISGAQSSYNSGDQTVIKIQASGFPEALPLSRVAYKILKKSSTATSFTATTWHEAMREIEPNIFGVPFAPGLLGETAGVIYKFEVYTSYDNQYVGDSFEFTVKALSVCGVTDCVSWGNCLSENNTQQQTCLSFKSGCQASSANPVIRACSITCQAIVCQSWSGTCDQGIEKCVNLYRTPAGCHGEAPANQISRSCVATDSTNTYCSATDLESACSAWEQCLNGRQIRTCSVPTGCQLDPSTTMPISNRTCTTNITTTCTSFTYGDWSDCQAESTDSGLGFQTRTVLAKVPVACQGYPSPSELRRACSIKLSASQCSAGDWTCSAWGDCSVSIKTRICKLNNTQCLYPELVRPPEAEACSVNNQSTRVDCDPKLYQVDCADIACVNGYQRKCKVIAKSPAGCVGLDRIDQPCQKQEIKTEDCREAWSCVWGDCQSDGFRIQNCQQLKCLDQKLPNPARRESCQLPAPKPDKPAELPAICVKEPFVCLDWGLCQEADGIWQQLRQCELRPDCVGYQGARPTLLKRCEAPHLEPVQTRSEPISSSTTETATDDAQTVSDTASEITRENLRPSSIQANLPVRCQTANITKVEECELYLRSEVLPETCREAGVQTKAECKELLEKNYDRPSQCAQLTPLECSRLINNVILSDYVSPDELRQSRLEASAVANTIITVTAQTDSVSISSAKVQLKPEDAGTTQVLSASDTLENILPIKATARENNLMVLASKLSVDTKSNAVGAVLMFDDDKDGLPNDLESRLGTKSDNIDSDGDGYSDLTEIKTGYNPLGLGAMALELKQMIKAMDWAVINQLEIQQPNVKQLSVDQSLQVHKIEALNNESGKYQLSGKAWPNSLVTVYIYSQMPLVLTTTTDVDGNWVYQLDKPLADGKHEIYVAINDDVGNIKSNSSPLSFFVKEAKAVTMDQYIAEEVSVMPSSDSTSKMLAFYIAGGSSLVLGALLLFFTMRKMLFR